MRHGTGEDGFQERDYILSINGTKIRNTSQAMSLIQACKGNMLNL